MTLIEMQLFCNRLCRDEGYHRSSIPVILNKKFKRLWGRAYWGNNERIEVSPNLMIQPDAIQKSVLIHEFCHILCKEGHTYSFFGVCEYIHRQHNLHESRQTKRQHGYVYENGKLIPAIWGNPTGKQAADVIPD